MHKLSSLLILFTFAFFSSCSNNSTDSGDAAEGVGSFTVTGDLDASFEGVSYFSALKNNGNIARIQINLTDTHPLDRGDAHEPEYSLVLTADLKGEPISMSTGSHQVGTLSDDDILFSGVFIHNAGGDYQHQSGTVSITSYSDDQIEASFELTSIDFGQGASSEEDKVISISGDFSAECFGSTC